MNSFYETVVIQLLMIFVFERTLFLEILNSKQMAEASLFFFLFDKEIFEGTHCKIAKGRIPCGLNVLTTGLISNDFCKENSGQTNKYSYT